MEGMVLGKHGMPLGGHSNVEHYAIFDGLKFCFAKRQFTLGFALEVEECLG
jgi:hypothetical protein